MSRHWPHLLLAITLLLLLVAGDQALDIGLAMRATDNGRRDKLTNIEDYPVKLSSVMPSLDLDLSGLGLVVDNSGNVYRFQGGPLTFIGQPTTDSLRGLAWKPDGSYALIVGQKATIEKYDGLGFSSIDPGVPRSINLQSVAWKQDGSFALISGSSGKLVRYDEQSVSTIPTSFGETIRSISWHPNGTVALLAGDDGAVFLYENGSLVPVQSGTTHDLYAAAWNPGGEYALLSGTNGTILKYDGASFTPLETSHLYNQSHIVRSITWNPTGELALLVGDTGLVLSYNGTTMVRLKFNGLPNITQSNLYGVAWWAGSATIIGGNGTLFKYYGVLEKLDSGVTTSLRGISYAPPLVTDFTVVPSPPFLGSLTNFTAAATGSPPHNFTWNFGDNTSGTGGVAVHTYLSAGNFTVTLTVTDAKGQVGTAAQVVTVLPWDPFLFRIDWADYDNSGLVNIIDLASAGTCFGRVVFSTDWARCSYWDLDLNGQINIIDFAKVALYFGRTLPEPFPGQGQPSGEMDPLWHPFCSFLSPPDQQYCLTQLG